MNIEELKIFAHKNAGWFSSEIKESEEDINSFEKELGFEFSMELKWLLTYFGYSGACGIESLRSAVQKTLQLRDSINLQKDVFILNDWNDAGIVLMIAGKTEVIWCGTEDVYNYVQTRSFPNTVDIFANYSAWVKHCLEQEIEESKY